MTEFDRKMKVVTLNDSNYPIWSNQIQLIAKANQIWNSMNISVAKSDDDVKPDDLKKKMSMMKWYEANV